MDDNAKELAEVFEQRLKEITADDLIGAHIAVPNALKLRDTLVQLCNNNINQWSKRQFGLLLIMNGMSCILSEELEVTD
jgi:hypothetical protein